MNSMQGWLHTNGEGGRMVVAASTGGHLEEMVRLSERFRINDESLWITFDTPQSRSLLANRNVHYLDYVKPRDMVAVTKGFRSVRRLLKASPAYDVAMSTGSAIALSVLPATRARGVPSVYIESACRFDGPSITGRILSRIPGIDCVSATRAWSDNWTVGPSVLGSYEIREHPRPSAASILVSLGTIRPYRFDALVDAVLRTGITNEQTTWQLGVTSRTDLPGTTVGELSTDEFDRVIDESGVVITHAGIGNVLRILDRGKLPIVVPRRRSRGEHVDDHQLELCKALAQAGIGVVREPSELTIESIEAAAAAAVARVR